MSFWGHNTCFPRNFSPLRVGGGLRLSHMTGGMGKSRDRKGVDENGSASDCFFVPSLTVGAPSTGLRHQVFHSMCDTGGFQLWKKSGSRPVKTILASLSGGPYIVNPLGKRKGPRYEIPDT